MSGVEFSVTLVDGVSGPAKAAASSVDGLLGSLNKAAGAGSTVKLPASPMPAMKDVASWRGKLAQAAAPANIHNRFTGAPSRGAAFVAGQGDKGGGGGFLSSVLANTPLAGLQDALKGGGGGMQGLLAGMAGGAVTGGVLAVSGALQKVGEAAMAAGQAVIQLGLQIASMAAQAAGAFLRTAYDAANFRGQFVRALDAIKAGGVTTFDATIAKATEYGLNLEDTLSTVKKYRMFGFDAGTTDQLVLATSALRGLGSTDEEISRVGVAISQIKAAGKLQGDELNQLAEAGVPVSKVYEALGQKLGKSVQEVIKLKEAGKITAELATEGIISAVRGLAGGDLEGFVRKATETVPGRWSQLIATLKGSVYSMVSGVDMTPMADGLKGITDMLGGPAAKGFVAGMGSALQAVSTGLGNLAKAYMPMIKGAFEWIFNGDNAQGLTTILERAFTWLQGMAPTVQSFFEGSWDAMLGALELLGGIDMGEMNLEDTLESLGDLGTALLDLGAAFAAGFMEPMQALTGGGDSPESKLDQITMALEEMGPAMKATGQLVFLTFIMLKPVIDSVLFTVQVLSYAFAGLGKAVDLMGAAAEASVSPWIDAFQTLLDLVDQLTMALGGFKLSDVGGSLLGTASNAPGGGGMPSLGQSTSAADISGGWFGAARASTPESGTQTTNNLSVNVSAQGTGLDMNALAQQVAYAVKRMLPAPKDA
jgi:tape measure domain-containing protein